MSSIFSNARLKLTAWYLVIIMMISGLFSIIVFQVSTREIRHVVNRMQLAQEEWQGRLRNAPIPPPGSPSITELQSSKHRLLTNLVVINGVIVLIAGGAAYFLAGKTLTPIKQMVDEQQQFISNSSHELRTPLATLRAEIEAMLLEKQLSPSKARKLLRSNLEEVLHLQQLSDKLLQLNQLHSPDPSKYSQSLLLKPLLEQALKQTQALARAKKIQFQTTLTETMVRGDKDSLSELFVILLDNAIKYSPAESQVEVVVTTTQKLARIMITDHGIGIAAKDLPHVFERFFRADASRSQTPGFGLGLSIAQQIVTKHGGTLSVSSQPGQGSTFAVTLPAVE